VITTILLCSQGKGQNEMAGRKQGKPGSGVALPDGKTCGEMPVISPVWFLSVGMWSSG
jgi:hypothetical protein